MGVAGPAVTPFVPPTLSGVPATAAATGPTATSSPGGVFATTLQQVSNLTQQADGLAVGMATGGLQDIHQFTTAAAKAQLGVELTVAVRNRAVEAYQEIMRMQV